VIRSLDHVGGTHAVAARWRRNLAWAAPLHASGTPEPSRLSDDASEAIGALPWAGWAQDRAAAQGTAWESGGVPRQRMALLPAIRAGAVPATVQVAVETAFRLPVKLLSAVLPEHTVLALSGGSAGSATGAARLPGYAVEAPPRLVGSEARGMLRDAMRAMTRGVGQWRDGVLLGAALTGGGESTPVWVGARALATRNKRASGPQG